MAPETVIVIHLAGIGDLLMGRLALEQLRQGHRHSRIVLLTWTRNLEAAALIPGLDESYGLELGRSWRERLANWETLQKLRHLRADLAVNAYQVYRWQGVVKLAALLAVLGARRSAGRDTDGKGWCFNQRVREHLNEPLHEVERQSRFIEQLGCPPVAAAAPLTVSLAQQQQADAWLSRYEIGPKTPYALVNPGGARAAHRWPVESFAAVAASLEKDGLRIVITGSAQERPLADVLAKSLQRPAIAAGELKLAVLAELLRRSRLMITNDSGPMHLAAGLGIPLVAIFGPGNPQRYGPYPLNRADQLVIHATGDPLCLRERCPGHEPLKRLPAAAVLEAARAILGGEHPAGIRQVAAA